jgi:hypothetical protein
MGPLRNPRHEKFSLALAEGKPASTAYAEAGYSPHDGNCIRLRGNERVKARLAELQAAAQRDSEVTIKSLLAELEEARQKATSLDQMSAAVRSVEAKARISGLLVERVEVKNDIKQRWEQCITYEDFARVFWDEYRESGVAVDEEDYETLVVLFRNWLEGVAAIRARVEARAVSPRMSPEERERIERRRLGLSQRPLINGSAKSVP